MKGIFKGLIKTVGLDYVMRIALVSALQALAELVADTDSQWDDKVALPIIQAIIARLQGEDPLPVLEAAKPELERFAGIAPSVNLPA